MQGFMHLLLRKTILVARNRDRGNEDIKCTGIENLVRGSTPTTLNSHPGWNIEHF